MIVEELKFKISIMMIMIFFDQKIFFVIFTVRLIADATFFLRQGPVDLAEAVVAFD